ncbi:unnamed protein product [Closterium sp. NIES-53]
MSKVLIAEGLGYNLLSVSQLMAKGIHLEADSTTQEFKLYHGKRGLYIGKAVLKNVFVLDFVPDLGTADSDAIVNFTNWTHPPDLDPDFSPEGFWYSHTIPEAERTRVLATIQTTSAAAETTSAAAETTSAVAEPLTATAGTSTPIAGPSTTPLLIDDTPPTPAQQLHPAPQEVHRSANFIANFYSNSDMYRRSPGHRADESTWHARMGHPSNTVLNNTIRAGVLDKDSLLLTDGRELQRVRGTCFTCPEGDLPHRLFASHHNLSAPAYAPPEKVYSDILYNQEPGQAIYNYTITLIDAATCYVWHLNLPSRDMAFAAFVAWLPVAERESGVKLKSFQSDGGGEYTSQRFKQYLAERGIKRLISLPYAHQQQGVAERTNRTLQNSMLKLEPNQVCQLLKSLYGIKQAPRLWQQYLHTRLFRIGFKQLPHDQGMYRLTKNDDYILLIVYEDDLLYIGSNDGITTWFEGELQRDLTLTVSSTVYQYLGLNIREEEDAIYLSAEKYADTIAKHFTLTPTAISTPYRYTAGNDKGGSALLKPAGIRDYQKKLGCLLFAAVTCRPDLSYSASQLATYLKKPEAEYLAELNRALHYFVSTPTIGLTYYKNATTPTKLIGYVDADHAGDSDNRRSRTGYIYRLEPIGPISWQSSKQELIALSSAEAEYIALYSVTKEGLYLRELLEEAKLAELPNFTLFCDNQSAIRIANKNGFANRTKHIALRYFFVKDEIEKGRLELSYCPTSEMAADYLTKKLGKQKFEYCMLLTGQSHVSDTPEAKGSVGNN